MEALNKLLTIAAITMIILFLVLFAVNLDSARAVGVHTEQFIAKTFDLAYICMTGVMAFGALTGATWLGIWIAKRRNENMRQRDGSFPLQCVTVLGHKVYIDVNKTIAPALIVGRNGIQELFTAAPELHLQAALGRSRVASMQALAPGDHAIESKYGSTFRANGLMNAASARLMAGAYDKTQKLLAEPKVTMPEPEPPAHVDRLRLHDVLNRATPTGLIAGQASNGDLAIFDPHASVHAGIVGATGTGKTSSAGYVLVAQALRTGYDVVILDPKGGADWQPWSSVAEWHASDSERFPAQVDALWKEHQRRAASAAPTQRRTLVVIEEYGDLISQLRRTDRKRADDTDATLDRLMRLSRSTGIHLLMIDQYPEEWSQQVIAGCKYLIVFRLGPNQGAKVGQYKADRLPDRGRFLVRERQYDAWFAAPHMERMLGYMPPKTQPAIIDGEYTVLDRSTVPSEDAPGVPVSVERSQNANQNGAQNGTNGTDEPGRWDDVVSAWFAHNPQALTGQPVGISELARAMCLDNEGSIANYEAYKGRAHKLFHDFRAAVRLPGGDKLGIDISYGG